MAQGEEEKNFGHLRGCIAWVTWQPSEFNERRLSMIFPG